MGKPPRIVYIARDYTNPVENVTSRTDRNAIDARLTKLYTLHRSLSFGDYHIVFIWAWKGKLMTDVWIHELGTPICPESGALATVHCFADIMESKDTGHASDDTFTALYFEAMLRRKLGLPVVEYVNRGLYLPEIPPEFMTDESFIIRP